MEKRSSWTTARLGIMPPGISRSTATNVVNQAPLQRGLRDGTEMEGNSWLFVTKNSL